MIVLLMISIVLCVCKSVVYNQFAKSQKPDIGGIFRFNAVSYGTAAMVTCFFCMNGKVSLPTVLCAAAYAVTVFFLQALSVAAMTVGPMSLTSLMVLYGMIIPSLAGPVFWHEPFGIFQAVGMIMMLISIWMLRDKENRTAAKKSWAIMAGICFLLSGMAGVIEKVYQSTEGREERLMFQCVACAMMFIFSLIGCLCVRKRTAKSIASKPVLLLGAVSGMIVSVYSQTNLILAGNLNSLIYYPVANGGALLLTVLISAAVFREQITGKRMVGFLVGLCAIILLSLPAV